MVFRVSNALSAYDDHKHVLEVAPSYSDAKVVVGVYNYIVAALPVYERVVAFMLSIRGSKTEGIESIRKLQVPVERRASTRNSSFTLPRA